MGRRVIKKNPMRMKMKEPLDSNDPVNMDALHCSIGVDIPLKGVPVNLSITCPMIFLTGLDVVYRRFYG
jgi:hypothetical protein